MSNFILMTTVIFFTVLSQVILKIGQSTLYYPSEMTTSEILKMSYLNLTNPYVIGCILLTLFAGLAWIMVIQNMPLSQAYPFMSLNYVLIFIISWLFFSEPLSLPVLGGIFLVMIGTGLLGFK